MATIKEIQADILQSVIDRMSEDYAKPWTSKTGGFPKNLATGREFQGLNVFVLWFRGFESNYWVGYRQAVQLTAKENGRLPKDKSKHCHVRKGEKGTWIIFPKLIPNKAHKTDPTQPKKICVGFGSSMVFNIEQLENVDPALLEQPEVKSKGQCRHYVEHMLQNFVPTSFGGEAYYNPAKDTINMPHRTQFDLVDNFYAVWFHEAGHATGHKDRHDRFNKMPKAVKDMVTTTRSESVVEYAFEELVAEMFSAYACAKFGIEQTVRHGAYINSWGKALGLAKEKPEILIKAASLAWRALQGFKTQEEHIQADYEQVFARKEKEAA